MTRFLEIVLALAIIGSTLGFGGVTPLGYSLMELVLFLIVFLLLLRQLRRGELRLPLPLWPVLFALFVLLQVVPLPSTFISRVSPSRAIDLGVAGLFQAAPQWSTLSIYPHDTWTAIFKYLAYVGGFLIAAHVFDSRKRKSLLISALILLGFFEAGYALYQYLTDSNRIFTYSSPYGLGAGTYINHNHLAGMLEMVTPFVLAYVFYSFQLWSERSRGGHDRDAPSRHQAAGFQSVFYLFLMVIMVLAVFSSGSRMGILATIFVIICLAFLSITKASEKTWALGVFGFLILVVGYGLWIGLGPVLTRFEKLRAPAYLETEGRLGIWRDSLNLMREYPLVGTGLGTYGTAYRRYQTTKVDKFVDHAHNDYLEVSSETGFFGVAILFVPIGFLMLKMIAGFLTDPRRYRRSMVLGSIGSSLAMLIHSTTDFNLHIPSNALIFAVVLGIGYKAACVERKREDAESAGAPPATGGSRFARGSVETERRGAAKETRSLLV